MGLFDRVKLVYTGEEGSIVRIPCRNNSDNLIFTGAGKAIKIYEALQGKHHRKGTPFVMEYFGFRPAKDVSDSDYRTGYTATHTGNGNYRIKENRHSSSDAIAMEVYVGASPEVVADKKSNVNKWLRSVAKPTRGLMWWLIGLVTIPAFGFGLLMLGNAIYRKYLAIVRKSCVRKAKKSYKQKGYVEVF